MVFLFPKNEKDYRKFFHVIADFRRLCIFWLKIYFKSGNILLSAGENLYKKYAEVIISIEKRNAEYIDGPSLKIYYH